MSFQLNLKKKGAEEGLRIAKQNQLHNPSEDDVW